MKKVVTLDAVMVSFVSAIGYGVGMVVPGAYGVNSLICFVICMVLGTVLDKVANKIVFSGYVQESNKRRYISFVVVAVLFLGGYIYMARYFAYSLWTDAKTALVFAVVIPVVFFFITFGVDAVKRKKLLDKYGTGESGFIIDEEVEKKWKDDLGKNAEVSEYTGKNPTVKTVGGTYIGKADKSGVRFLGIPYAKAPVGVNRWKKPIPIEASDKIYEAYYFGNSEIQPESNHNILNRFNQNEDCLNLNIWTKELNPEAKKPVMVYFHSGDGRYGGSANPIEHLKNLATKIPDLICVSVNYRIGVFGVVKFPGDDNPTTALSLLDQIEALKWVKENISAFGGDPENITVAGGTSGGSSIMLLASMKEAKGLFKRAFVMCASTSDVPLNTDRASEVGKKLFEEFNATSVSDLEKVTSEQLRTFTGKHHGMLELSPRDGKLVPADIDKAYLDGVASDVEFIFGIAADDVSGWQAMIVGDVSLDDMTDAYYQTLIEKIGSEKAVKLNDILQKYIRQGLGEYEAKRALLGDFLYKVCVLRDCKNLSRGGSKVKVFYWDVKGDIEKFAANSVSMISTILGNSEIAEQLGYINDKAITEITQTLIGKYIRGEKVELYKNEIKGVDAVTWDDFDEERINVLHIEKGSMSMDENAFSDNVFELAELLL